jgi:outer membrane protein assembly factor BamB
MSPTVSPSGIGTIGFGPDFSNCTTLVGVDTHTGKTLWSTSLTTSDHTAPTAVSTFIDGQVGVIVNDNVLGGVNLTDGHVVWGYKARGQYCNAYPYGGVGTVLVDDYCADVNPSYVVTALDAATGKQLWQKPGSDHVEFGGVLDSSPLIAIVNGTGGSSAVNRYDSGGNATALTLKETIETTSSGMGVSSADAGAQTVGSTLVFPSRPSEEKQDITGINPTTGATLWTYDGETHGGAALMHPAQSASGAGAGKVYAISFVNGYGTGAGPEVVAIDAATGKSTVIAKLPANPDSLVYSSGSVYLLPDGRVLLASADASGTAVRLFK